MEKKDFSIRYGCFDHSVYYKGVFVCGAGTLRKGRRLQTNVAFHKQQAELEIDRILKNGKLPA